MKIKITDIIFDPTIYPRLSHKSSTVQDYVDSMEGGGIFPAIILETGTNRLLDGYHRWKSHEQLGSTEIEAEYHEIPEGMSAKLYSAQLNMKHGDRMTPKDKETLACELFNENPDCDLKDLAKLLSTSQRTLYRYLDDLLVARKNKDRAETIKLHLLGWTQKEIAQKLGVSQSVISERLSDFAIYQKTILLFHADDMRAEEIARRHNLPISVIWAIVLEGLSDKERFEKLELKDQRTDVLQNLETHEDMMPFGLHFYTKPGDSIVDLMGIAEDACLKMGRRMLPPDTKKPYRFIVTDKAVEGERLFVIVTDCTSFLNDAAWENHKQATHNFSYPISDDHWSEEYVQEVIDRNEKLPIHEREWIHNGRQVFIMEKDPCDYSRCGELVTPYWISVARLNDLTHDEALAYMDSLSPDEYERARFCW
jgi:DNA-directed RNA polymerase specialized sigma24 family protein